MRRHAKAALTALGAAIVLAALVGTASANHLSTSSQTIRATWSALEFTGGGITIRCAVTLEGSLHSATINKTVGALIGAITAARVARPCVNGTAWAYNGSEVNEVLGGTLGNSLPWHITYEGFTGTLPEITSVRILLEGARFLLRATLFGIPALCNYTTGASHGGNATGTLNLNASHVVTSIGAGGEISSESGGFCPRGTFSGNGVVTQAGSSTSVTITLI